MKIKLPKLRFGYRSLLSKIKLCVVLTLCCGSMLHAQRNLSNANASKEAKALYRYIQDMYGKKILSGQMWSGYSGDELAYIQTNTGKQPALRGMDFMSSGDNNAEVQRAIDWWKGGGIPTIMWHWGAPTKGDGYNASQETIDINRCFQPGTAEYTAFWNELRLKADLLQRLRDANVPVLWRPYHELNGGWFWWGKGGAEQFKRLWTTMYNYFVNERGLNNLIWVLCYTGTPDGNWFPGNQYVDIGGADTYNAGDGPQLSMYNQTKNSLGGNTMPIAYHECGIPPNPDQCKSQGAMWSWWMEWHSTYLQGVDKTYLRFVYNHDLVITKDEVPNIVAIYGQDNCTPTTISPAIQVNGGTWQSVNTIAVNAGTSIKLGPQPATGGSWSWTGCGTSGTAREQTIAPTSNCTATATYTNACGAKSTMAFTITINGATGCGTDANGVPYCCTNSDPDGDGWGWENNASCVVRPAPTQLPNGTYTITARHSGKVLDVYNSSTANDGNVDQWTYVAGAANQKWVVENLGSGTYSIKALHSGKSLDVAGNSLVDGADINQWTYNATNNQKWKIESVGSGYYKIVSVNSGKCVDVVGNSTADGAAINQYTCSGTNNQSFTFQSTTATARTAAPINKEQLSEVVKTVIYPNPSSGLFTVAHTGSFSYTINNSLGMAVEKGSGNDEAIIGKNISASGLYILTLISTSGSEKIKLIKN